MSNDKIYIQFDKLARIASVFIGDWEWDMMLSLAKNWNFSSLGE